MSDHRAGTDDIALGSLRKRLTRNGQATIYALYEGEALTYVGLTQGTAHARFVEHRTRRARKWSAVRVLERVPYGQRHAAEAKWIAWAKERGAVLSNSYKMGGQ